MGFCGNVVTGSLQVSLLCVRSVISEHQTVDLEGEAMLNSTALREYIDEVRAMGGCTAADEKAIMAMGPGGESTGFPGAVQGCSKSSLTWTLALDKTKFTKCIRKKISGLTDACAKCVAIGPEYGIGNCKSKCMGGACGGACQTCSGKAQPKLAACTGFTPPDLVC